MEDKKLHEETGVRQLAGSEAGALNRRAFPAGVLALVVILAVVIADQVLKIWVKTSFWLGEDREITSWFHLIFVENNGMAFGWHIGSKIVLTVFRILFAGALIWCIWRLRCAPGLKTGFVVCVALIVAGALGNIIDCCFYGLIFNNPAPPEVATAFHGGYAPFLQGRVVDMLSFQLFSFNWPSWMPFVGGEHFEFFRPIFNLADSAITVGILVLIIFYSKQLSVASSLLRRPRRKQQSDGSEA